jgi:hypothetical protein
MGINGHGFSIYKNQIINRGSILSVQRISSDDISGSSRRLGTGGVFGYHGTFENSTLGTMLLYITRTDRLVLIRMAGGVNVIVSPDSVEDFLMTLR